MTDPVLAEDQGFLLLLIGKGRGQPVTVERGKPHTDATLEWMESNRLISVKASPEGWRCAILVRGRTALRIWRDACAERMSEPLAVEIMR